MALRMILSLLTVLTELIVYDCLMYSYASFRLLPMSWRADI